MICIDLYSSGTAKNCVKTISGEEKGWGEGELERKNIMFFLSKSIGDYKLFLYFQWTNAHTHALIETNCSEKKISLNELYPFDIGHQKFW